MCTSYIDIISERKIRSFNDLPEVVQEIIISFEKEYKPNTIKLGGSFYKGYWYIGNNDLIKSIRKEIYKKEKVSDIDIYTDLILTKTFRDYSLDLQVTILDMNPRDRSVLIYDNGRYI
jgi:hypothetical protein